MVTCAVSVSSNSRLACVAAVQYAAATHSFFKNFTTQVLGRTLKPSQHSQVLNRKMFSFFVRQSWRILGEQFPGQQSETSLRMYFLLDRRYCTGGQCQIISHKPPPFGPT